MISHHDISHSENKNSYVWENESITPFKELIVSWNAKRPSLGHFIFFISLKINEVWSPWYLYASWGSEGQSGSNQESLLLKIKQDTVEVIAHEQAAGFRVRIEAENGANLREFISLAANTHSGSFVPSLLSNTYHSIEIRTPSLSQMQLNHPHHRSMCSATSTAAVTNFFKKEYVDPVDFALKSHDNASDIYGNWVLNIAQASSILGKQWKCWVQRLSGFEDLYRQLEAGMPVVVSVKGPLPGSALPYNEGHLIAVKGYCAKDNRVLCMDPAFSENETTNVSYDLHEFMQAWSRRGYIAYLFQKR
jgi:hypothetical protein